VAADMLDEIVSALNSNPRLAPVLDGQLEGILVPTDKSRVAFFVALAIWIRHDLLSTSTIARITHECVKSISTTPELAIFPVLQIIISAKYPSEVSERVVRILIERESYQAVVLSDDLNYRLPTPVNGVKCGWYIPQEAVDALA